MATIRSNPPGIRSGAGPVAALLAAALAAGCGSKSGTASPPAPGSPVVVDAAGGTVPGPGGASVTVPPGATATPVTIQVAPATAGAPALPADVTPSGPVLAITPHGATFAKPVTVTLPVDAASLASGDLLVFKAEAGGSWQPVLGFALGSGAVELEVTGFSYFFAGTSPPLPGVSVSISPVAAGYSLEPSGDWQWSAPRPGLDRPELLEIDAAVVGQPLCPLGGTPALVGAVGAQWGGSSLGGKDVLRTTGWWVPSASGTTRIRVPFHGRLHYLRAAQSAFGTVQIWAELWCADATGVRTRYAGSRSIWRDFLSDMTGRTLGLSLGPRDLTAATGSSPELSIAVIGGAPSPTENDQARLEWQRSDDGGVTWRSSVAYQRDLPVDPILGPDFTVRWSTYRLPAVQLADGGAIFRTVACYELPPDLAAASGKAIDCAFSPSARLTVTANAAPVFTAQPAAAVVTEGATATFTVVAAGTPAPTLQWQSLAPGAASWADVAGATATSTTTPAASLADNGTQFRAVATNLVGTATSAAAMLAVSPLPVAPLITSQPVSLSAPAGSTATFAVVATGTAPLAYQWSKGGVAIPGATAAVHTIAAVVAADAGSYTVTVSNGVSPAATSLPATLTVIAAPAIATQPASITVTVGQAATFTVAATGASLSHQWLKNGVAIPGATGASYTTPATAAADGGAVFSVVVSNAAGSVVSAGAVLTVFVPPPPTIASVTPATGPTGGGTAITVAGTGFQPGATVTVGGAAATAVTWVSATGLTATTPAGLAGAANVVVTNPDAQSATAAAAFTYVTPTLAVTAVLPANASAANPPGTTVVEATFSAPLDCAKTTAASLQVFEGAVAVPGTVGCAGSTFTFQPAPALPTATSLRGHVDAAVASLAGGTLGAAYDWTFGMGPWTRQAGTTAFDQANAVVTDPTGDVFAVGNTQGGLDGNTLGGLYDTFAVKYSPSGGKLWTRQLSGAAGDLTLGNGAAADAAGNLYVVGSTFGTFDLNVNAGSSDAFVVKFDAAGTRQWSRLLGTAAGETAAAAATDASGNLYVVGWTGGNLDGNVTAGLDDLFVAKLDGAGTKLWTRQLGSIEYDQAKAVAVDGAGNVYVAGQTFGGIDGNLHVGATTTVDGFLVKYDAAGTKLWTRQFGTAADDWTYGVAADGAGNAYVVGRTQGGLDGNVNADPSGLTSDAFLVKYDATGVKQWTKQFGSATADSASDVATDAAGNLFVSGATSGALEAGSTNSTGNNLFVARFDAAGTLIWLHQRGAGAATSDGAASVTVDAFGGVFAAGLTNGGLDGNVSAGGYDAYVVKYQADGTQR